MNIDSSTLVTAFIPTKNRADLLPRAIDSVFEQTWENLELIVVDDASDDGTAELLAGYDDSRLRVIRNETSKGAAACRNIAIREAKGEFVTGLDDDDFWREKRVEYLLDEFEDGYSAVTSNDRMMFGEKEAVWKKKPVITLDDLLYYNQVGNQVLTKKEYILNVGGYDEDLTSAQDYDLWIRLAHDYGPVKTAPHTLQVINMDDERERITTSDGQVDGYRRCLEKHEAKMNDAHKNYQDYRLRMVSGDEPGWIEMFRTVPRHLWLKEITRKLFL